jgi:hypothetical protein
LDEFEDVDDGLEDDEFENQVNQMVEVIIFLL